MFNKKNIAKIRVDNKDSLNDLKKYVNKILITYENTEYSRDLEKLADDISNMKIGNSDSVRNIDKRIISELSKMLNTREKKYHIDFPRIMDSIKQLLVERDSIT